MSGSAHSQIDTAAKAKQILDSILRDNMQQEMSKNIRHYQEKMSYSHSLEVFSRIRQVAGRAEEYMSKGIDSLSIKSEFSQIRNRYDQSVEGVFPVMDSLSSYRNLGTTELLLGELATRLNTRFRTLQRYISETESFRRTIDSLVTDTSIYHIPSIRDSVLFQDYIRELTLITYDITPVDELINQTLQSLRQLEQVGSELRRDLQVSIKICAEYRVDLGKRMTQRELPFVFDKPVPGKPLKGAIISSFRKSEQLLRYYLRNNSNLISLCVLLFIVAALLLTMLRNKVKRVHSDPGNFPGQVLLTHPVLSALFLVLNTSQFFFRWPPFVFFGTAWLIAALAGTFIYFRSFSPALRGRWLLLLILFIVMYANNLVLFYTISERYFLWGAALFTVTGSAYLFLRNRRSMQRHSMVMGLSGLVMTLALFSLVANTAGRYNLSKLMLTAGYFGVMTGILLYFTGKMINDWLNLAAAAIEKSQTRLYLRFRKSEPGTPGIVKWLLVAGWALLFLRNFTFYQVFSEDVREYLLTERSIGNFSYTFSSILIFIAVLFTSVLLARFIALFSSTEHLQPGIPRTGKKGGFNNWLLLIRIAVITTGILLAFASAGIP
ncbi:MAG: hypothetical protein ACO25B_06875, partial [Chitinophagaceae bacterium]